MQEILSRLTKERERMEAEGRAFDGRPTVGLWFVQLPTPKVIDDDGISYQHVEVPHPTGLDQHLQFVRDPVDEPHIIRVELDSEHWDHPSEVGDLTSPDIAKCPPRVKAVLAEYGLYPLLVWEKFFGPVQPLPEGY